MLLVGVAVPLCHEASLRLHRWRTGYERPGALDEAEAEAEAEAAAAAANSGRDAAAAAAVVTAT